MIRLPLIAAALFALFISNTTTAEVNLDSVVETDVVTNDSSTAELSVDSVSDDLEFETELPEAEIEKPILFKVKWDSTKTSSAKVKIKDASITEENSANIKFSWDNSVKEEPKKKLKFGSLNSPTAKLKKKKKNSDSRNVKFGLSLYEEAAFAFSLEPRLSYFLLDISSQYSFDILLKDRHEFTFLFGHTLGIDKLIKARAGYLLYLVKPSPIRLGIGVEGGPLSLDNGKEKVDTYLGLKGTIGAVVPNKKFHIDAYGLASLVPDFIIEGGLRIGLYF